MTKFDKGFGLPLVLHYRTFENMGAPKAGIMLFQSQSPNQSHPFNSQGDAIIITHPTTLMDETRIVTMVLSNVSIRCASRSNPTHRAPALLPGYICFHPVFFASPSYLSPLTSTALPTASRRRFRLT